jgi:peptidoglycan/LPS O-acetylase OafA/YrhL
MKLNNFYLYDYFIIFIFIVKILFVILSGSIVYLKMKHGKHKTQNIKNLTYWKDRVELIFVAAICILLMYLFYPLRKKALHIDDEVITILFLYGIITLINLQWNLFVKEIPWFYNIQKILGRMD